MNSYVDTLKDYKTRRSEAVHSLNDQFDKLLPRWKGVALTASAELQAEEEEGTNDTNTIPWANMHDGISWRELFQSMGKECRVLPVMECTGTGSCQMASNGIKNNKKINWIKLSHLTDIRLKTPK